MSLSPCLCKILALIVILISLPVSAQEIYKVNSKRCIGCRICKEVCPVGAISIDPSTGKAVVDTAKCIKCGKCVPACPMHAIYVEQSEPPDTMKVVAESTKVKGKVFARIDQKKCIQCRRCVPACPTGAIYIDRDGSIKVDTTKCIGSGECKKVCPVDAIELFEEKMVR